MTRATAARRIAARGVIRRAGDFQCMAARAIAVLGSAVLTALLYELLPTEQFMLTVGANTADSRHAAHQRERNHRPDDNDGTAVSKSLHTNTKLQLRQSAGGKISNRKPATQHCHCINILRL
jgi:hypothetical protein